MIASAIEFLVVSLMINRLFDPPSLESWQLLKEQLNISRRHHLTAATWSPTRYGPPCRRASSKDGEAYGQPVASTRLDSRAFWTSTWKTSIAPIHPFRPVPTSLLPLYPEPPSQSTIDCGKQTFPFDHESLSHKSTGEYSVVG